MTIFFCGSLAGCYSFKQLYYHGNLLSTREPISVLLWHSDTDPTLKKNLRFVKDVLEYAKQSGLNNGRAYRTYIKSPYPYVSYTVQAARPFEMKLKKWSFPIVGEVPYLGFYHPNNRDQKAEELKRQGFDVHRSAAGAFSSLGWYDDPIYSSMLNRTKASLAHLLFHELTHRTFWIPGDVNLNEHLAEFVAGVLTVRYLNAKGMRDELQNYRYKNEDRKLFKVWLRKLKSSLEQLYAQELPEKAKLREKQQIFSRYLTSLLPKFKSAGYRGMERAKWNNAKVLAYALYEPKIEPFQRAYKCLGNDHMGSFLAQLEAELRNTEDISKALDRICNLGKVSYLN